LSDGISNSQKDFFGSVGSRETLYEEVWAEPMTAVAARYNVSSSFLGRSVSDSRFRCLVVDIGLRPSSERHPSGPVAGGGPWRWARVVRAIESLAGCRSRCQSLRVAMRPPPCRPEGAGPAFMGTTSTYSVSSRRTFVGSRPTRILPGIDSRIDFVIC